MKKTLLAAVAIIFLAAVLSTVATAFMAAGSTPCTSGMQISLGCGGDANQPAPKCGGDPNSQPKCTGGDPNQPK
jgi:hypothetical protein